MNPVAELHESVLHQDAARVGQLLQAAADPAALAAARDGRGRHALHWLASELNGAQDEVDDLMELLGLGDGGGTARNEQPSAQQVQVVRLLAAACPALACEPISGTPERYPPLHWAARRGWTEVVGALLEAAPAAALHPAPSSGKLPLHLAAKEGHRGTAELLLQAAPAAVCATDRSGHTPLDELLGMPPALGAGLLTAQPPQGGWDGGSQLGVSTNPSMFGMLLPDLPAPSGAPCRCDPQLVRMLLSAPGQDPRRLLQTLVRSQHDMRQYMPEVASRYPLTPADWQLIPSPCPALAAVLPTVLRRSEAEAALLVARLPDIKRRRLRTAALALHRAQAEAGVALPQPLIWRILASSLA